jgi:molecular chaperone DnaK
MIKNAEAFKAEDSKKREIIEVKNQLDSKIHSVERVLVDNKANLTQELVDEVTKALNEAKQQNQSQELDEVKKALEHLEQVSLKIGTHIY